MDRAERVQELLEQASAMPAGEVWGWLARECGNDASMCREVQSLVEELRGAGRFLGTPTAATRPDGPRDEAGLTGMGAHEGPGSRVGPYKILQLIGEGGFGSVYMAEQDRPVVRRVALKIIKLGMATRQVIARFEAERQALALMDHPNIAKVLDAGETPSGQPYFVMELCAGDAITRYCAQKKLTVRERLELFVQVCRAVQHAHQKGVIHRDIKPSNILVTTLDGRPHARVIDFGIAKAISSRLTEKTLFTEHRAMIGTPEYMSPEQAESSPDVDTRADVYSLGVLLYELLTGTTPFDPGTLRSAAWGEMQRIIREEEPPKPSTRVASTLRGTRSGGQMDVGVPVEPERIGAMLRGDLDWVVMKALEKDRSRRYDSAGGLASDVQRFLAGDPVTAAPPDAMYRVRKFLKRHRGAAIAAALIAGVLVIGLATSTVGFVLAMQNAGAARSARDSAVMSKATAEKERERADERANELREELYVSNLGRAQHLIETGSGEPIRPILAACPQELRGWEWDRLNWLLDRSRATVRAHQTTGWYGAATVSYSSDGRRLLTFGDAGAVRVWDAVTLRMLMETSMPTEVKAAVFSADGASILAGDSAGLLRLMNSADGRTIAEMKAAATHVRAVALSPDGRYAAAGVWDGDTVVLDVSTGKEIGRFGDRLGRGQALAFSGDATRLLIGSLANDVTMVDTATWTPVFTERGAGFVVHDAAISRDGTRVASVGQDARLWVRQAQTGRLVFSVLASRGAAHGVAFHPSGDYIAVAADEGIVFFDAVNGERLGSLTGHDAPVLRANFHPDGRAMASLDQSGVLKVWELGSRAAVTTRMGTMGFSAVAFAPDGARLYLGTSNEGVRTLDAASLRESEQGKQTLTHVERLAVSPDSRWVAARGSTRVWGTGWDSTAVLLDASGAEVGHWATQEFGPVFSGDGALVGFEEQPGAVSFRDTRSGAPVRSIPRPARSVAMVAEPGTPNFVFATSDGEIGVVDGAGGRVVRTIRAHDHAVTSLTLLPAAHALATTCHDSDEAKIWNWPEGTLRKAIRGIGQPGCAALSPDGRRLVTGGGALAVGIWDTDSGRRLLTIGLHSGQIMSVAISPDGRTIASCGFDHALNLWETASPSPEALDRRYERDAERWKVRHELVHELGMPGATNK